MKNFSITLCGVKINFATSFEKYAEYFAAYFEQILAKEASASPGEIEISFDFSEGSLESKMRSAVSEKGFTKIGANTYSAPGRVMAIRKIQRRWKLLYDVTLSEGRLKITIHLQKKPFKDFFRYGLLAGDQHEWFFNVTYYLLYYPLFWYLAHEKNMHPLHASAVRHNGKGIIIVGLEGIGKTSLGLKFLQEHGAQFLSDNLVFYDSMKVYPCYELIRMHAGEEEGLWKDNFERVNAFNILKNFYRPKFVARSEGIRADIIIFPEFAGQFAAKSILAEEAANRAITLSYLPSELNHYEEYRNLFDLLDPSRSSSQNRSSDLLSAFRAGKAFRVAMPKENGLDKNFLRLKESLP